MGSSSSVGAATALPALVAQYEAGDADVRELIAQQLRQLPNKAKPLLIRSLRQFAHGEVLQELEKAVTSDNPQAFAEIPTSPTPPRPPLFQPKPISDMKIWADGTDETATMDSQLRALPAFSPADREVLSAMRAYRASTTLGPRNEIWEVNIRAIACTQKQQPVALCMHGHGSACTAALWARFFPSLVAAGFHVLAFDSPGFGRSSGVSGQTIKWRPDDAELVLRLLRCFGVSMDSGRVAVLGQCMGGAMFLRSFVKEPGAFRHNHVLHNCTIGTWPFEIESLLTSNSGKLLSYWDADDDHLREANVYKHFSRLHAAQPQLCRFVDLLKDAPPGHLDPLPATGSVRGWARASARGYEKEWTSGLYMLEPSSRALDDVMKHLTAEPALQNIIVDETKSKTAAEMGKPNKNFKVYIRVRPMLQRELKRKAKRCCCVSDFAAAAEKVGALESKAKEIAVKEVGRPKQQFVFDDVLDENSSQQQLYDTAVRPLLHAALSGTNVTLFCYGQTGTGKTYTIEGGDGYGAALPAGAGMLERLLRELFSALQPQVVGTGEPVATWTYLQLYNDTLIDLTAASSDGGTDGTPGACVWHDSGDGGGGIRVEGATETAALSVETMLKQLAHSSSYRATGATNMNEASSRSHAILTLKLRRQLLPKATKGSAKGRVVTVNFVDLAGSERAKRSQATGARLGEATDINPSLHALGNVVSALVENHGKARAHIPYRDSVLTRLLRSSLGGNTRTALIACVSPAEDSANESISTLRFALRATWIKNDVDGDSDGEVVLDKKEEQKLEHAAATNIVGWSKQGQQKGEARIPSRRGDIHCIGDCSAGADAPLIMLLHYYGGDNGMWASDIPTFAEAGYRVIAPSLPGHGKTPGKSTANMDKLNQDGGVYEIIQDLADYVGAKKVNFLGFGWGGGIAIAYTLKFRARVSKLVGWLPGWRDPQGLAPLKKMAANGHVALLWDKDDPSFSHKKGQLMAKALGIKLIDTRALDPTDAAVKFLGKKQKERKRKANVDSGSA